jgi:hypothetical protein
LVQVVRLQQLQAVLLETTVALLHLVPPLHQVDQRTLTLQLLMLVALVELVAMETLEELELQAVQAVQPEVVELVAVVEQAGPVELSQALQMLEMVAQASIQIFQAALLDMAVVVQVQTVHPEVHHMEAQLAISYLLQRVQQETVLPIEVAVELEQQMVTVALVVRVLL